MDEFEEFLARFLDDPFMAELYKEMDEIQQRHPEMDPVDDFVERIWRREKDKHRNPLRWPRPGD